MRYVDWEEKLEFSRARDYDSFVSHKEGQGGGGKGPPIIGLVTLWVSPKVFGRCDREGSAMHCESLASNSELDPRSPERDRSSTF